MNTVKPYLETVGKFTIEQIPCPHFSQAVDLTAPRAGVLHTTEGNWTSALGVFKTHFAPHFLLGYDDVQKRTRIAQLVQVGTIGAALVTHNWLTLVQVEVIGYSKQTPWFFDDDTAEALAALLATCKAEYGIPLSRPWPDGVYGMARADDPHRNGGQFGKIAGWYAHGDAPSPDSHWDVGNLQWSKLFALASAIPHASDAPTPPPAEPVRPCACGDTHPAWSSPTLPPITPEGIQNALNRAGASPRLYVDGIIGDATKAATRAYQIAHFLTADGIVGVETWAALQKTA